MSKNVLSLTNTAAKKFFLKQEAYLTIDLPPYFVFEKILAGVNSIFKGQLGEDDLKIAKQNESVNHILYGNKDGKYAWRKYEIINPLLYVSLVNIITEKDNWEFLQSRFKEFQKHSCIECESVPVLPKSVSKQKAAQISQWVNNIEKKSVALALEYNFLYQTDISDCYGSIYTHSLPWAIHTKEVSKKSRKYNDLFGNKIDNHIQAMSFGQTNGIPQGSILMDFIAEIVLGYADSELFDKLSTSLKGKKYHILRYRDDYRIFVNDISDGDIILKNLSEVLLGLGFRLNTNKTFFCNDVVSGSIKHEKIGALKFEPVPKRLSKEELFRQLLIIHQLGREYPNSGVLTGRLSKLFYAVKPKDFKSQEKIIASLLVDIAYNNPNSFPIIAGLISNCTAKLSQKDQRDFLVIIQKKICTLSNIGLLEIWTQRMAIGLKFKLKLKEGLCKSVYNANRALFKTSWITDKNIRAIIDSNTYVDQDIVAKTKPVIGNKEVQIFNPYYN